jgi:hypothetical protein
VCLPRVGEGGPDREYYQVINRSKYFISFRKECLPKNLCCVSTP